MSTSVLAIALCSERDLVRARQRTRQVAAALGFDAQAQTRVATAVSEVARHACGGTEGGRLEFALAATPPQRLVMRVLDRGGVAPGEAPGHPGAPPVAGNDPGADAEAALIGARRLVDRLDVSPLPQGGTVTTLEMALPRRGRCIAPDEFAALAAALGQERLGDPVDEVQAQNQELLRALDELSRRQDELQAMNRELEDTNRGVVALYAELDEKAESLRRADALKSRFLSNMSHEFRTPVNSIRALAKLLLARVDGDLSGEQDRQVRFILRAADELGGLVDDLLDLAKVEAGKVVMRPAHVEVAEVFAALRGMLRPLLTNDAVTLVFEDPVGVPTLFTDEAKLAQILRNLITNGLKFTEQGEVRVAARVQEDGERIAFVVTDTGIGIAPADHARIFQEFGQVDGPIQRRVRGTGLGLPLCRRLAELLGGTVTVRSELGMGATFIATIAVRYAAPSESALEWHVDAGRTPVLLLDEENVAYERAVAGSPFQLLRVGTLREAEAALARLRPAAIVLVVAGDGDDGWKLLTDAKRSEDTRRIPVLALTTAANEAKALALGAEAVAHHPIDRQQLMQLLGRLTTPERVRRVLVIDDEDVSRYIIRQHLMSAENIVLEAASGAEGLALARRERPDCICLDLVMPEVDGFAVLAALRAEPSTRDIPVVVVTSRTLDAAEREALGTEVMAIVSKSSASRDATLAAIVAGVPPAGPAAA